MSPIGVDISIHTWGERPEQEVKLKLDTSTNVLKIMFEPWNPVTVFLSPKQTADLLERAANGTLLEIEGPVPASPQFETALARIVEPVADDDVPF